MSNKPIPGGEFSQKHGRRMGRGSIFDSVSKKDMSLLDAVIMEGSLTRKAISEKFTKKLGFGITPYHIRYRERHLKKRIAFETKELETVVAGKNKDETIEVFSEVISDVSKADEASREMDASLHILHSKLINLADVHLEDDKDQDTVNKLKRDMNSVFRYAKELFDSVPYVSYLNFIINVMQIRIAKRFELETKLGIMMKENSNDIKLMVEVIEKAIQLNQSLGLLRKVDTNDNVFNIQNNNFSPLSVGKQVNEFIDIYRQSKELPK